MKTRRLTVQHPATETGGVLHQRIPLTETAVAGLLSLDLIYPCDEDGHDLHLNPDHTFDAEEVEILLLALGPAPSGDA